MNNNIFVSNALKYIAQAYEEDLSLEQVAEKAGFSVSYFNRIFAENTGKTVMEYVREYRLIKAAESLRTSDKSILDISLDCGYSNPENFTRAFKSRYGVAPSEYREAKKNESLSWNDLSSGTSVKRFESAFPQYKRIDKDEFIDWIYINNPIKHAFTICFAAQIESAAFKLGEDEYAYIEEYRPDEITLSLYCEVNNTVKYVNEFKSLSNIYITAVCDSDCKLSQATETPEERFDYVYLNDNVQFSLPDGYIFREIEAADTKAVKQFSTRSKNQVWHVFEQNEKHGNFAGTLFLGLWNNDKLVACAMPGAESARGISVCDIGGIFFSEKYFTKELYINFWKAVINYCLVKGFMPINGGVTAEDKKLGCKISEAVGYTCVAHKYIFKF